MAITNRPRPEITRESEPYWSSVAEHAMRLQRCTKCGTYRFYPTSVCPVCWSTGFTWEPVSGRGTLYSFSVVYRPVTEAFADEVPYIVVLVTLAEGPTMMMNLLGVPVDEVRIGMPVRIGYRDGDAFTLPVAEPEEGKGS